MIYGLCNVEQPQEFFDISFELNTFTSVLQSLENCVLFEIIAYIIAWNEDVLETKPNTLPT